MAPKNWHVPESLEKQIPIPKSLHKHMGWWLKEQNVLIGQPLHPLQIFTNASSEAGELTKASSQPEVCGPSQKASFLSTSWT